MSVNGIGGGANNALYQQMLKRAQGADAAQGAQAQQRAGGAYNEADYLRELNDRLDATVVPGAWDGKSSFGAGGATAMIHPEFLKKMHDDPALGAEYEKKINDWAEIDAGIRERMAGTGNTITSLGMSVDKDGKETYHMAGTFTSGGPGGKPETATAKSDDKKTFREEMEEMLERLEEERQKEKLDEKRRVENEAAAARVSGESSGASYSVDRMA